MVRLQRKLRERQNETTFNVRNNLRPARWIGGRACAYAGAGHEILIRRSLSVSSFCRGAWSNWVKSGDIAIAPDGQGRQVCCGK